MNKTLTVVFLIIVAIVIIMVGMQITQGFLGGKNPQTTSAQAAYDRILEANIAAHEIANRAILAADISDTALKASLCNVASSKLNDIFDGYEEATQERIDELKSRCAFQ